MRRLRPLTKPSISFSLGERMGFKGKIRPSRCACQVDPMGVGLLAGICSDMTDVSRLTLQFEAHEAASSSKY